jgi:hypothetical protein
MFEYVSFQYIDKLEEQRSALSENFFVEIPDAPRKEERHKSRIFGLTESELQAEIPDSPSRLPGPAIPTRNTTSILGIPPPDFTNTTLN